MIFKMISAEGVAKEMTQDAQLQRKSLDVLFSVDKFMFQAFHYFDYILASVRN
jgi:hypothetical protein